MPIATAIGFAFLTTVYVIDETLTLLRARGERTRALLLRARFFRDGLAEIHKITELDLELAWETFEHIADKDWSFTDCISKVVIERLGITQAFAFDHHFKQFSKFKSCHETGYQERTWRKRKTMKEIKQRENEAQRAT